MKGDPFSTAVSAIGPISLAEADCVRLMTRTDEKYVCPVSHLPALLLKAAPGFRILEVNGTRIQGYRSVYLDTPDHRMYIDHHNGKQARYKIRVREYMSNHDMFLEIKKKDNRGSTEKIRMPFEGDPHSLSAEHGQFITRHTPYDPGELQPALISSFSRITLISTILFERVTLDIGPVWQAGENNAGFPGVAIIEVKSARKSSSTGFGYLLREERILPVRVSKYCTGTCLLYPGIKHNRFKQKMLHLRKVNGISEKKEYVITPA